jgi:hypothetical protein
MKNYNLKDFQEFSDGKFRKDKRFDILFNTFMFIVDKKS